MFEARKGYAMAYLSGDELSSARDAVKLVENTLKQNNNELDTDELWKAANREASIIPPETALSGVGAYMGMNNGVFLDETSEFVR
jgi:hypothetical protein